MYIELGVQINYLVKTNLLDKCYTKLQNHAMFMVCTELVST
jgi:hypothetical protein